MSCIAGSRRQIVSRSLIWTIVGVLVAIVCVIVIIQFVSIKGA